MSRILLVTILCCMTFPASARRKDKMKIFAETAAVLNLNGGDVDGNSSYNMLHPKSNAGGSMGLGFKLMAPLNITLQVSMGLRFSPQNLEFKDQELSASEKFVTMDYYLRVMLGYSLPITSSTKIDIGLGFQNFYALRKKDTEGHLNTRSYTNTATGETLNYLSNVYSVYWGDSRETADRSLIPFVFAPTLHLGLLNTNILTGEENLALQLNFLQNWVLTMAFGIPARAICTAWILSGTLLQQAITEIGTQH